MTIRHRMILLAALTFTAIAMIGGISVFQSQRNASKVQSVTEVVVPNGLASADLVSQLKEVQFETLAIISAPNLKLVELSKEKLEVKKRRLREALNNQVTGANDAVQIGLITQVRESLDNYFLALDRTVRSRVEGRQEVAQATFFGTVVQYQIELEQIVETLRLEKRRSMNNAIVDLNDSMKATVLAVMVSTLAAIGFWGIFGIMLYRQITRPISRMQTMMGEIASSQDFTRRVPIESMDEIGQSISAFNGMIEKIEEGSGQLKRKTADIQSMLENIPQGILMVVENNKIHAEYSRYLETMFETQHIAGRSLMDLVFSRTDLRPENLLKLEGITKSCIGEGIEVFARHQNVMVGQIRKKMADGRVKILDLTWSPIADEMGKIVQLMLCLRDVSELRKLATETSSQRQELEMIGEILRISQERFHDFIVNSRKVIRESEAIIRKHPEANQSAIAELYSNIRAVKGDSITHELHYLTNILQEIEGSYEELRKPHSTIVWNQKNLTQELSEAKNAIDRYATINEEVLGRKGPGRNSDAARYLVVERKHIQETLHRLETVNTGNLHELLAARESVRKMLHQLGTVRVAETLASAIELVPSLSKELGKNEPLMKIEETDFAVHNQTGIMLKNVFTHLFRNAIDHGIERPGARVAKGKPPAGTIHLRMGIENSTFQIAFWDDGNGLPLRDIRKTAVAKGIISERTEASDEEVARFIFLAGFSTATRVTAMSGNGGGMAAIQDLVRREGGRIEIRFIDENVGAAYRTFVLIVHLPASCVINSGNTFSGNDEFAVATMAG